MNKILSYTLCTLFTFIIGCVEQEYSACPEPNNQLEILFKEKSNIQPFAHSFCIVCNTDINSEEIQSWAMQMGASSVDENPETPCLYAYANRDLYPDGFETLEQCELAICEGGASYNDIVRRDNGNINLTPLIGSEQ